MGASRPSRAARKSRPLPPIRSRRRAFSFVSMAILAAATLVAARWLYPASNPAVTTHAAASGAGDRQAGASVPPAFVKSATCAQCHAEQYQQWAGSHHELAMQPATSETVRANFNDVRVSHRGVTSRFFKRGEKFYVNTEGPDGKPGDFEVKYTFGVAPLQQYLVELSGGRVQGLTTAWDTGKKQFFQLYPGTRFATDDPLHWTGHYQNWNAMCADCHSTALKKNYDSAAGTYKTTWSEINVACEACHGPGEAHVAWARGSREARAQSLV